MRIVHIGEESPHIFQKTSGMSLKFSGTPSPPPPHTAFSGLNRWPASLFQHFWYNITCSMIFWYFMIVQRHIQNPDKKMFLQIFTRNYNFSLGWSATTLHNFRLLNSVSLGQIRISLAMPIALKRFTHRSEEGSSPSSLKNFTK